MLLPLRKAEGIDLREESVDDGDVLRVTFSEDPKLPATLKGPYAVVFDKTTSLLKRIEFETPIFGVNEIRHTRFEFLDYRNVDGIMVPFTAKMSAGDQLEQEVRVEQVTVDAVVLPALKGGRTIVYVLPEVRSLQHFFPNYHDVT